MITDTIISVEEAASEIESINNLNSQIADDKSFTLWNPKDFANYSPDVNDAILSDDQGNVYWRNNEIMLLLGPGGVGKSRLTLHMAIAQVLGWPFLGFKLPAPSRRWLFIGNENSARRFKYELGLMTADISQNEYDKINENIFILPSIDNTSDCLEFGDANALKYWKNTAKKVKPDILVVDPWEAVIRDGDCNDASATRDSIRLLRSIFTKYNDKFTPMIVHHSREGSQAAKNSVGFDAGAFAKGSKTIVSMARFAINIAPEDPEDGSRIVIICGKINNAAKFRIRAAIMNESTHLYELNDAFDKDAWLSDIDGKNNGKTCSVRDVVEAVKEGKHNIGAIIEVVKQATGAGERTIKRRIKEACKIRYLQSCAPRGSYTLGDKQL
jgi:RecA-family ATPase